MKDVGTVQYGDAVIRYQVAERPRRKTLGIEVHPDGCVLVLAPSACDDEAIARLVRKRARWVRRQQQRFERYMVASHVQTPRQYLSGETHRYLGRSYRLRVVQQVDARRPSVKLGRSDLVVVARERLSPAEVRVILDRWFVAQAKVVFQKALDAQILHFKGAGAPVITVRKMRTRWGSLSPSGRMTLNVELIHAPVPCIEYVVMHELCHTIHGNHSAAFYAELARLMPDWRARKQQLEGELYGW